MAGLPKSELDKRYAKRREAKAQQDIQTLRAAEENPNQVGLLDTVFTVPAARRREAMARKDVVPVQDRAPSPPPPTGLTPDWQPFDAVEMAGIRKSAINPDRIVANAMADTDKAVAGNVAAKQKIVDDIRASNRAAIENASVASIDAEQAEMEKIYGGRLPPIALKDLADRRNQVLTTATQGVLANDQQMRGEREAIRKDRATDGVLRASAHTQTRDDVPASVKSKLAAYSAMMSDPQQMRLARDRGIDPLMETVTIMMGLTDSAIAAAEGGQAPAYTGIEGKAEGGMVGEETAPMIEPAIGEALPMETGDYIIPVEAMRFYGRKFFMDLIAKAEDAEMG